MKSERASSFIAAMPYARFQERAQLRPQKFGWLRVYVTHTTSVERFGNPCSGALVATTLAHLAGIQYLFNYPGNT